jgi:hypothetical protein
VGLFAAILLGRMAELTERADTLARTREPGPAFFEFFAVLVREGATHRGLAEALAGAGYDLDTVGVRSGFDVSGQLRDLLERAQQAGAVRTDVAYLDVKALMTGCMSGEDSGTGLDPLIAVVCAGLRA